MKQWKDVVGYEDLFMVSNLGDIFSKRTNKILKQGMLKTGYKYLSTKIGGKSGTYKCFRVHRLVAEAFIENKENKPFVNHIDGNKLNNNVENLEWCTAKENAIHAYATGLSKAKQGEDSSSSKLTELDVLYIRSVFKSYDREFGARALARLFNINKTNILSIVNRESWRHI